MTVRLPYEPSTRDRIAYRLANAVLRLGSPTYRALLGGTYRTGIACALHECPTCHPLAEEAS